MKAFIKESDEIPQALCDLVEYYRSAEAQRRIAEWVHLAGRSRLLVFGGMGTSQFAPELVQWSLAARGRHSSAIDAGEWAHYGPSFSEPDSTIVLISQSGESAEVRNLVESRGVTGYVALTNDESSTLASKADLVLPLVAGAEAAITTKTYTNTLALLVLLSATLDTGIRGALDALASVASEAKLLDDGGVERAADALMPASHLAFVARGPAIVSARQCALTYMEGLKRTATAFTGGAFRHGPFESTEPGFRTVLFRSPGATVPLVDRLAADSVVLGATVVVFDGVGAHSPEGATVIQIPRCRVEEYEELMYPILVARAQNGLLAALASRLGVPIGEFRYGRKITNSE